MHKLYLTAVGPSRLRAMKAVRDALKVLDPDQPNALKAALELVEVQERTGFALIGQSDDWGTIDAALDTLTENDSALGIVNPTDEQLKGLNDEKAQAGPELSTIEANPTYASAMVFLTMTEGNPVKAFAYAYSLASVSDASDHYQEVMAALLMTFPWIMEMAKLADLGFIEEE